ncbi:unnamed protein product, partial [Lymnaea stagnalis]
MDVFQDNASNRDIFYKNNLNFDCLNEGSDIGSYPESSDTEISKYLKTLFSIIKQRKKHHAGEISRLAFIDVILNISGRTMSIIHMYLKLWLDPDNRKVFNTKSPHIENNKLKYDCQETMFKCKPLNISNYKHIEELNFYIRSDDGETSSSNTSLSKHVTGGAMVQRSDESDDLVTKQKDVDVSVDKVDPIKGEHIKITASDLEDAFNSVTAGRVDVKQEKTQHVHTVSVVGIARKFKDDRGDDSEGKKEVNMDVVLHQGNFPEQRVEIAVFMQPSSHPNTVFGIPWNALNREINRILTFASYPKDAVKSALLLAAEGFVYIGSGQGSDDQVKCYFCCGEMRNWRILDVIREVHRRISSSCSMVTGVNCDNDPISAASYLNNSSPLMSLVPAVCNNKQDVSVTVVNTNFVLDAHQHNHHASDSGFLSLPPLSTSPEAVNIAQNSNVTSVNLIQTDSALDITQTTPDVRPGEMSTASTVARVYLAKQSIGGAVGASASSNSTVHQSQTTAEPRNVTRTQQSQPSNAAISTESVQPSEASRAGNSPTTVIHHPSTETQPQRPAAGDVTNSTNTTTTSATNHPGANSDAGGQSVPNNGGAGDGRRNGNGNGSPTYSELGIITERPKRVEYALTIKRFETFSAWPRDHHLQPKDLAEAGFYYAGYGDCARCFYCGGGLRNWEDEDDVLVEHARWFPKCAYIRQKMGQNFVEAVQELNKQYTQITYNMVIEKMGASSSAGLEMKETLLQKDPALTAVKECGYCEKDVSEIAQLIKDE